MEPKQLSLLGLQADDTTVEVVSLEFELKPAKLKTDINLNTGQILKVGDKVSILFEKYGMPKYTKGVVKSFLKISENEGNILIQRDNGEGLYKRHELHLIKG